MTRSKSRFVPLATLPVLVPATLPLLHDRLHGALLGLSSDFWTGAATGAAIGLQLIGVALIARERCG